MKRWRAKLVLFLLLGAVVNVAVAWGLILWTPMTKGVDELHGTPWPLSVPAGWPLPNGGYQTGGYGWELVNAVSSKIDIKSDGMLEVYGLGFWTAGLPARSMRAEWRAALAPPSDPPSPPPFGEWRWVWHKPAQLRWIRAQDDRHVPLRPVWPGFAINTVFYGVLLWMLWLSPFAVRRFVRDKRGQCIKCGYDLRGAEHGVCPECGVSTKRVEVA